MVLFATNPDVYTAADVIRNDMEGYFSKENQDLLKHHNNNLILDRQKIVSGFNISKFTGEEYGSPLETAIRLFLFGIQMLRHFPNRKDTSVYFAKAAELGLKIALKFYLSGQKLGWYEQSDAKVQPETHAAIKCMPRVDGTVQFKSLVSQYADSIFEPAPEIDRHTVSPIRSSSPKKRRVAVWASTDGFPYYLEKEDGLSPKDVAVLESCRLRIQTDDDIAGTLSCLLPLSTFQNSRTAEFLLAKAIYILKARGDDVLRADLNAMQVRVGLNELVKSADCFGETKGYLGYFCATGLGGELEFDRGVALMQEAILAGHLGFFSSLQQVFAAQQRSIHHCLVEICDAIPAKNKKYFSVLFGALAVSYFDGDDDRPSDFEKSYNAFKTAALFGTAQYQYQVGRCLYEGWGTAIDLKTAFQFFFKAAEQGHPESMLFVAKAYWDGVGVVVDRERAATYFKDAISLFEEGVALDDSRHQYNLAECYEHGWGVSVDSDAMLDFYMKAAEAGHKDAQVKMGQFCRDGCYVQRDLTLAVYWFQLAARQGEEEALYQLGLLKKEGARDITETAIDLFKRAYLKGNSDAGFEYSKCLMETGGTNECLSVLTPLVESGHVRATVYLADLYQEKKLNLEDGQDAMDVSAYWRERAVRDGCVESVKWCFQWYMAEPKKSSERAKAFFDMISRKEGFKASLDALIVRYSGFNDAAVPMEHDPALALDGNETETEDEADPSIGDNTWYLGYQARRLLRRLYLMYRRRHQQQLLRSLI